MTMTLRAATLAMAFLACTSSKPSAKNGAALVLVEDVAMSGGMNRFDYQDIDSPRDHLIIAHMGDNAVEIVSLSNGAAVARATSIDTPRGVVVANDVKKIFITAMPNQLVVLDSESLIELTRVTTGAGPDGVAWDSVHSIVGVSDQHDGALSLIAKAGSGQRTQIKLGSETGNVVFDPKRSQFWITAAGAANELVSVDPLTSAVVVRVALGGCQGAHGLRLHPDGASAFIACEGNSLLARVDLSTHAVETVRVGDGPDVLAIDAGLGWLYVAAESGDLHVFDLNQPGLVRINEQHIADGAHSVSVDAATHRVFFPLSVGLQGKPSLRIMRPAGL